MVANTTRLDSHRRSHFVGKSNRRSHYRLLEALEDRALLSSTLFVTAPGGTSDATHFQTLQAALAVANTGDTVMLQSGFAAGTFISTTLSQPAAANANIIRTVAALDVGDVISIGSGGSDPVERDLVTAIQLSEFGDYIVSLATPLASSHTGSTVSAANNPTIGISKGITLTAGDAGAVLPFNLEIWKNTTGATLSNFSLTNTGANNLTIDGNGNTISHVTVSNQLILNNAHTNTLSNVTVAALLSVEPGSSGNTINNSTLFRVTLKTGSNTNSFSHNNIAGLTAQGTGDSNGHDTFNQNTFTGRVLITGNSTTPTADSFAGNTFIIATGEALHFENAGDTSVTENTFTEAGAAMNVLFAHNSDNLVISGNHITTTGSQDTGIYVFADGAGSSSADIRDNTITTNDGFAIYLAKYSSAAALDVRLQGNDLRNNAVGVYIFGDGASAGNVDIGGGSTRFGASSGGNLFTSFASSDAGHFAVGLFAATADFTVHADSNTWGVTNPSAVVADTAHTLVAAGSGIITVANPVPATPPTPPTPPSNPVTPPTTVVETLTENVRGFTLVQGQSTCGTIAHLTSNVSHVPGDYTVTINWGDGTTSTGKIVRDGKGFNVVGFHAWKAAGSYMITVSATTNTGVSANATGTAMVSARVLSVTGTNFSVDQNNGTPCGQVGTFRDNLPCGQCGGYVITIAWSDGVTTTGKLARNWDGSFAVRTSRSFPNAGALTGTITVATSDGLFSASGNFTVTVNAKETKSGKSKNSLAAFQPVTHSSQKDGPHHS